MTYPIPPRLPAGASASQTPPQPSNPVMRDVAHFSASLRDCAHVLGGMIEHFVEGSDTAQDAVVLVIPQPFIAAYRRELPGLLRRLGVTKETP